MTFCRFTMNEPHAVPPSGPLYTSPTTAPAGAGFAFAVPPLCQRSNRPVEPLGGDDLRAVNCNVYRDMRKPQSPALACENNVE